MPVPQTPAGRRRRQGPGPRPLPRPDRQVLVAPAARWTLGDQDALDVYLRSTTGPVDLVLGSTDAAVAPSRSRRVGVHVLPDLLTGSSRTRRADHHAFLGLLDGAAHCTVLAPDGEQGARSTATTTADLADLARPAAVRGLDTRVLGFSWCSAPNQRTVRAVRSAVRAGAVLHVGDDLDWIRAMNDGVPGLRRGIDLRFCGTDVDSAVVDALQLGNERFALLDVAAVGVHGTDTTADVIGVVAHLLHRGLRVVLTPQDPRADTDLALCDRAAAVFGRDEVHVLAATMRPAELRAAAARAQLVVTGRRSLAILALTCGTPVVGVAGDREVTEVLRLVGTRDGCVQPRRGFVSAVRRLVDRIVDDRDEVTGTIDRLLPDLVALAGGSLRGLPLTRRPGDVRTRLSA